MLRRDRRLDRLELAERARDDLRARRLSALFAAGRLRIDDSGRVLPDDPGNPNLARIAELCNLAGARRDRATRAKRQSPT